MSNATVRLEPADDSLGYVETLLAENGLPAGDVRSNPGCFYVAFDGDDRVGVGGLERHGVKRLWLLTTTAADFFAARGYERVDRSVAPERIRATTEFADLCPDRATCLRTSLSK